MSAAELGQPQSIEVQPILEQLYKPDVRLVVNNGITPDNLKGVLKELRRGEIGRAHV